MTQGVLRTLAGVAALVFLVLGLLFLLGPFHQTGRFAILPTGNAGLGTIRGDLGGLFLAWLSFL
jgi:hypothetical protein